MALLQRRPNSLVVTGGGSGGHALAGISIAEEWKTRFGNDAKVIFIGAHGGLEEKLVPRAGIQLHLLRIGSLNRVSTTRKLRTALQLPCSLIKAAWILLKEKPMYVIGVGGYAAGPVVLAGSLLGWIWGGKTAIIEQNLLPGMTNRILARFVNFVFAAFPGTKFSRADVKITGNPIQSKFKPLEPPAESPFTIFIFGGSQGAIGINTLIIEALPFLDDIRSQITWIHQTGELDYERVLQAHKKLATNARVEKFIFEMEDCYRRASLVICRAGASTLSELARVKRAAILIPLPTASDNHQAKNAQAFEKAGAAKVLIQTHAQGKDLADMIRNALNHPHELRKIENSISCFSRPNAGKDLLDTIINSDRAQI